MSVGCIVIRCVWTPSGRLSSCGPYRALSISSWAIVPALPRGCSSSLRCCCLFCRPPPSGTSPVLPAILKYWYVARGFSSDLLILRWWAGCIGNAFVTAIRHCQCAISQNLWSVVLLVGSVCWRRICVAVVGRAVGGSGADRILLRRVNCGGWIENHIPAWKVDGGCGCDGCSSWTVVVINLGYTWGCFCRSCLNFVYVRCVSYCPVSGSYEDAEADYSHHYHPGISSYCWSELEEASAPETYYPPSSSVDAVLPSQVSSTISLDPHISKYSGYSNN